MRLFRRRSDAIDKKAGAARASYFRFGAVIIVFSLVSYYCPGRRGRLAGESEAAGLAEHVAATQRQVDSRRDRQVDDDPASSASWSVDDPHAKTMTLTALTPLTAHSLQVEGAARAVQHAY